MPRKTEPAYETENGVFPKRLKEIMKERGENQTSLAKKITEQYVTIQRQTISLYMNGQSKPDTERLTAIAKVLNISADWLLGLSEVKSTNYEVRQACKYTGLSENSVETLRYLNVWFNGVYLIPTIDLLLEQEELPPDRDVDFHHDVDTPTPQEENEYKQEWVEWEKKGCIPVLSAIDNYLSVTLDSESAYNLSITGEILKSKQGHTPKDVSFGSIHKVQASDIVERILLSDIEDKLKKLKKKYDSSDSEANHK